MGTKVCVCVCGVCGVSEVRGSQCDTLTNMADSYIILLNCMHTWPLERCERLGLEMCKA